MSEGKQQTRQYWRSVERLLDSPALQGTGEEFSEGARQPPDEVDRRTVMKLMGASLAMAGMTACRRPEERIVPYVQPPERIIPGVPVNYATSMALGTNSMGLVVESHEGRPTKIEGNEMHPSSRGAASSWMQASIINLYDPDRSRAPRRRAEDGSYAEAGWSEFDTAWKSQAVGWRQDGGSGLAILAEESCSPTVARLAAAARSQYPDARWVSYDPISDRNIFAGVGAATGQELRPGYRLQDADVILALDCDFLLTESDAVANARAFADGRRPASDQDRMKRLYVAESAMSLTGANADHRWALPSRQIPALVATLGAALGVAAAAGSSGSLPAEITDDLAVLVADLQAAGSRAAVLVGRNQPASVHAAVYAINYALGAVGVTVRLQSRQDLLSSPESELADLVGAIGRGEVQALLIFGGNPAFNAPAELDITTALAQVPFSAHLSNHLDETSRLVTWHLPASHYLEAWSDVRNLDGGAGVCQPLIAPLFDTRSTIELLGLVTGEAAANGYEEVRETWTAILPADNFEAAWNQVLHDGLLPSTETPAAAIAPTGAAPAISGGSESGMELVVRPSASLFDGRFANNSWLQELPDPISKLVWDNALHISPADAAALGVTSGNLLAISTDQGSIEAPAWVSPGQAVGSVSISLGYGRTAAGVVGTNIGFNPYPLGGSVGAVTLAATGGRHQLVQTQEHWAMEGRSIVREATLAEFQADPDFATRPDEFTVDPLWAEHDYTQGYQWGMTIDLSACTGCSACVIACQSENNIPVVGKTEVDRGREMHWLRIDRYYSGDLANPGVVFQPVPCMHCENAPCEQVCPVAATVHDREGINSMVYNRCIGTRYCSNNCPYKVRRFNFFNFTKDTPETMKLAHNPNVTVRSRGVMEKCSYCLQRISEARIHAKSESRQIADGEIKTACQQTCPADAIVFGNINDPASRVSRLKATNRNYQLLAELYNKPRTSYLAGLTNPNGGWSGSDAETDEEGAHG